MPPLHRCSLHHSARLLTHAAPRPAGFLPPRHRKRIGGASLPASNDLSWVEIAALCRRQLTPAAVRRLDRQVWRKVIAAAAELGLGPEELARAGLIALRRLPPQRPA